MPKDPKISLLLSLLFPGLGHLYLKQYIDALVFLIATAFLWFAVYKSPYTQDTDSLNFYVLWGGVIIVYLYAIFDALRKTNRTK